MIFLEQRRERRERYNVVQRSLPTLTTVEGIGP